jgi:hypothetical protein
MKITVYSRGTTVIDAGSQYQEPAVREAITAHRAEEAADDYVASAITGCTGTERSDISHDEYAGVSEDDGTELWRGWLSGDPSAPAPDSPALAYTPAAYQGAAQHTYTAGCDGFHEPGQCPRAGQ